MKRLLLLIVLACFSGGAFAQLPQIISYQAIVRDGTGNILADENVAFRITFIQGSPAGTEVYVETFSVTTNNFGLVNLGLGSGIAETGAFSSIDWSTGPWYLRVELDPAGGTAWVNMGTNQFLSVPFALHAGSAGNVNDPDPDPTNELQILTISNDTMYLSGGNAVYLGSYSDTLWRLSGTNIYNTNDGNVGIGTNLPVGKLVVQGDSTISDSIPLFEVKDKEGNQVFVVYNDRVQVYILDDAAKSNKGGFAVSGRNTSKTPTNEYLRISPDSARIWLNEEAGNGGFAVLGIQDTMMVDYLNVAVDTTGDIDPSEARILWYPTKEAFLTGRVLIEDPDSVGLNSFASGFESKAVGDWSQAMGYHPLARGNYSTAIGKNAEAAGENSFAFGDSVLAGKSNSFAFGRGTKALGTGSIAFGAPEVNQLGTFTGNYTVAEGDYSFAMGMGARTTTTGMASVAIGLNSVATNYGAAALGANCRASGLFSFSMGAGSYVGGDNAMAIGISDTTIGTNAMTIGTLNKASGQNSMAIGFGTSATALSSAAIGTSVTASGSYSMALGFQASTNGMVGSLVYGDAGGLGLVSSGNNNEVKMRAIGGYVFHSDPALLEMNTVYISSLTGRMGIGWSAPAAKLDINGSIRVNSGTVISKIQAGTANVGTNPIVGVKVITVTFATPFTGTPKVVVTPKGGNYNDVFVVTTRNVNNLGFQVNVYRVDNSGGSWSQNLDFDWWAWE